MKANKILIAMMFAALALVVAVTTITFATDVRLHDYAIDDVDGNSKLSKANYIKFK